MRTEITKHFPVYQSWLISRCRSNAACRHPQHILQCAFCFDLCCHGQDAALHAGIHSVVCLVFCSLGFYQISPIFKLPDIYFFYFIEVIQFLLIYTHFSYASWDPCCGSVSRPTPPWLGSAWWGGCGGPRGSGPAAQLGLTCSSQCRAGQGWCREATGAGVVGSPPTPPPLHKLSCVHIH